MGRRRSTGERPEKKLPLKVKLIPRKHAGKVTEPWSIMERLISECANLEHLKAAKIRLWWQKDWKPDADNIATGAQVCKASEIDRNLVEDTGGESPDIFIKLPQLQWPSLDDVEKEHRIFHELCHVKAAKDANGKQKRDAKDRLLWRLGRHPIAAFHEEVDRYGVDRVVGHNSAVIDSIRLADRPMEKLFDQAEKSGDEKKPAAVKGKASGPAEWRNWVIGVLGQHGLPAGKVKLLEAAFDDRLGKLMDSLAHVDTPSFWYRDIKGLGEAGYDAMTEAIAALRKSRPEFQPDVK
jgi:hypothetical protein